MPYTNPADKVAYQKEYTQRPHVKATRAPAARAYRHKNRGNVIFLQRQAKRCQDWRHKNPLKSLLSGVRCRARRRGINLKLLKLICHLRRLTARFSELNWSGGGKKNDPYLPSLDRTVPELEYVKGNVVIMSARANTLKNDGTVAEFEALLAYMRANPTHGG